MSDIICWWSGGITSAVACKIALDLYGVDRCRFIMIDTMNEDMDTYRFKSDCEKWYGKKIETITAIGDKYESIQDVWRKYKSLNVANGAVCSGELKKAVRLRWQKENEYTHQVFGYEFDRKEMKRAISMKDNHQDAKPIFPLLMLGMDKTDCLNYCLDADIKPPLAYELGFQNNNCLQTGCVQGGIGYWQKMKRDRPRTFYEMADMEHELTDKKGEPVTMMKDQSKAAKASGNTLVFLVKHPDYPELKCIDDMDGREPEPLMECNGFCGTNDLTPSKTDLEINYDQTSMVDYWD